LNIGFSAIDSALASPVEFLDVSMVRRFGRPPQGVRRQLANCASASQNSTDALRLALDVTENGCGFPCSRPHPTAVRCSLLLTILISEPVALIAMMFPNDKNGMRVKPLLVSKEAAQRSGCLPTLIPFR
jgi:hypothetical protein